MSEQRTALITGANRGLGHAIATELYSRGLKVIVAARNADEAEIAAKEIGPEVGSAQLDVTNSACVTRAAEQIGPVDVLVCNAGIMLDEGQDPLSVPLDLVERTFVVNVLGAWRVAQAFVPGMVSRGWGRVVFISSMTGSFGVGLWTGAPGYSLSKSGVNGVASMLAKQTQGSGVLVNSVNPGRVRTRMVPGADREPTEAAIDIANVATLPDNGPSGVFLRDGRVLPW